MVRQVSQLLTAPAGTGKSYMVTRELAESWLVENEGNVYCNMPYGLVPESHKPAPAYEGETFAERIGHYVADRLPPDSERDADTIADQIRMIPQEVLADWRKRSGPWEYFEDTDLTGALIIIDECHNYCNAKSPKEVKAGWQQFCGELRHRGACIQFITQHPQKLALEIRHEVGLRQSLVDAEEERDPFFRIKMRFWYELRAAFTGRYTSCFVKLDYRDRDGRKTRRDNVERVKKDPRIFALYNSYDAPQAGGVAASHAVVREFERRSKLGVVLWFMRQNPVRVAWPFCAVTFAVLIIWFLPTILTTTTEMMAQAAIGTGQQVAGGETGQGGAAPVVSDPFPVVEDEALQEIEAELEAARVEAERLAAELEQERAKAAAIRVLTPESVTLGDGVVLRVGDVVEVGGLDGVSVQAIDWRTRSVYLSDGQRLRLEAIRHGTAAEAAVYARPSGPGGIDNNSGPRTASNDVGGRAATRPVNTATGGRAPGLDSGRAAVGSGVSFSRDSGSTGLRRVISSSPASGDGSQSDRRSLFPRTSSPGGSGSFSQPGRAPANFPADGSR